MLVSKSFLLLGETITRNGKAEKNIAAKVDAAINEFLGALNGATLMDIKPNVQIGTMQDTAFITVIVDVPEPKKPEAPARTVKK